MIQYRFEVWYQTKQLKMVNDFLGSCDLGIDTICIKDVITFNYTREEKPVSYFKDILKLAMENSECQIIHIEGGKIE